MRDRFVLLGVSSLTFGGFLWAGWYFLACFNGRHLFIFCLVSFSFFLYTSGVLLGV